MRRLELTYDVTNLSTSYEEKTVQWDAAEFTAGKDFAGTLRLWEDGVEPEQVWEAKKRLGEKAERFRVAMKYRGNHVVVFNEAESPVYRFGEREFTPRTEEEMSLMTDYIRGRKESYGAAFLKLSPFSVSGMGHTLPAPLPRSMPSIPRGLHWLAETLALADQQSGHPDQVIRLAYFVLEALEPSPPDGYRHVRNFVSHPTCGDEGVKNFVSADLPSAVVPGGVRFLRNDKDHMAFVAKYAAQALQRAKELFDEKVRTEGGSLGD